ncbi:MAG: TetR/AcrR family transcriptional regulator [Alphaproteobacteria bacterium]
MPGKIPTRATFNEDRRNEPGKPGGPRNSEQTRSRLIQAGLRTILKSGYEAASLDAIAAEAGFTKGAVYWHFRSKQELFLEAVAAAVRSNLETAAALLGDPDPDRVRNRFGSWIDELEEQGELPALAVELEIMARRDPSFRAKHEQLVAADQGAVAKLLERYFEAVRAEPPLPLSELSAALITIVKGYALARWNRPETAGRAGPVIRLLLGIPPKS